MSELGLVERKLGRAAVELELAGAVVPDDAVELVSIRRGRSSADEDPAPAVLSSTLATVRLALSPELGDELRVELTPEAIRYAGVEPDRLRVTYDVTATGGAFAYLDAGDGGGVVVPTGSFLEYDVRWEGTEAQLAVDLELSTGVLRDAGAFDTEGYSAHPSSRVETLLDYRWHRRRIAIPSSIGGGTLTRWLIGGEQDAGSHAASFRRVQLLDPDGRVLARQWRSTDTASPFRGTAYAQNSSTTTAVRRDSGTDPALRFVGTVTDLVAQPAPRGGVAQLRLTAAGPKARIGRLLVVSDREREEDDGARVGVLFDRARGLDSTLTFGTVDPGVYVLRQRDVDGAALASLDRLLEEAASSAGGSVVELRSGVVEYRDANARRNLVPRAVLEPREVELPSSWRQDLRGMLTDLTLVYGYEDANGNRSTVSVVDSVAQARHGRYSGRVTTELRDHGAAVERANDLVGRNSRPSWRIEGLALELLRTVDGGNLGGLLRADYGDALDVTGLPTTGPYTSARVFVEGGHELVTRHAWRLDLDVTDYGQTGPAARWADVPGGTTVRLFRWRRRTYTSGGLLWQDVDPDLSWLGAVGWYVGSTNEGRWADQPADLRWTSDQLIEPTWATY